MSYKLTFKTSALKEWKKLGHTVREQLKTKLQERLLNPHVFADRLNGLDHCYKIKLRSAGYRLVYQVNDELVTVTVVVVSKREKGLVYKKIRSRL